MGWYVSSFFSYNLRISMINKFLYGVNISVAKELV